MAGTTGTGVGWEVGHEPPSPGRRPGSLLARARARPATLTGAAASAARTGSLPVAVTGRLESPTSGHWHGPFGPTGTAELRRGFSLGFGPV